MGLFTLLARYWGPVRRSRQVSWDAQALAPRRLERRRVLDAAGAGLVLGPLFEPGEFVQAGELADDPIGDIPAVQSTDASNSNFTKNSPPT
ncbi:MAG: hypothetical protein MKZ95_04670, partial [Pirellulales bacterium]|nr:hypothetical protein [Pirellulales bacterium]